MKSKIISPVRLSGPGHNFQKNNGLSRGKNSIFTFIFGSLLLFGTAAQAQASAERYIPKPYIPADEPLYKTITTLDSLYFDTYNHCKLDKMTELTADDIEFYHDRGGLTTSKKELIESIHKNICGKVSRKLTKGSIEIYSIPNYGAVEIGYHSFVNTAEPGESHPSKFMIFWRLKDGVWQIHRVVSLH